MVKTDLGISSGDTLLFSGDSITWQNMYSHYLIAWFHLSYPELDLNTYAVGKVGSDLVDWLGASPPVTAPATSMWEEYGYSMDPDVTFMMLGQNGGQTASQHIATYEDLWTDWIDGVSGSKLVMMGMHPSQTATDAEHAEGKADAEATFAATDARLFASHTWDHLGPQWIANYLNGIDVRQPTAEPFGGGYPPGTTGDITHPGAAGHVAIAWAVLQGLSAETLVSEATINAGTGAVTNDNNCTISSVSATTSAVSFSRLDTRLPWAIDEAGRTNAVALLSGIANWQQYTIKITGLVSGSYTIKIDGTTVATATHTELASGVNLADVTSGPVWQQGQDTLAAIRLFMGFNPTNGDAIGGTGGVGQPDYGTMKNILRHQNIEYATNGLRGSAYHTAIAPYITQAATKMAAIHSAAQPVTRTWSIVNINGAAPVVTISSPAAPVSIDEGDSINLVATATDAEDGTITSSIVWTSSLDGSLGTGGSITPTLTAGFHIITATVNDSGNNESTDTVEVTVEAVSQSLLEVGTLNLTTLVIG